MNNLDADLEHIKLYIHIMAVVVACAIGLAVYWTLESDPLHVDYIDDEQHWSKCESRSYSFKRMVKSDKDLTVTIQERWHDLDGLMDYKDVDGEYVYSKIETYTLGAGFNKVMTFNKEVPNDIHIGLYEYRPIATYKVNPIKTITRMLPVQNVNVICEYDAQNHRAN